MVLSDGSVDAETSQLFSCTVGRPVFLFLAWCFPLGLLLLVVLLLLWGGGIPETIPGTVEGEE